MNTEELKTFHKSFNSSFAEFKSIQDEIEHLRSKISKLESKQLTVSKELHNIVKTGAVPNSGLVKIESDYYKYEIEKEKTLENVYSTYEIVSEFSPLTLVPNNSSENTPN